MDYLYRASDLSLFLIVSSFFILISIAALFIIRRHFPLHLRYQDNAVIGCTSALIGLIYGVLAGFATAHLVNTNLMTVDAIQHEANAIVDLYRDSRWLSEPVKSHIQTDIHRYLTTVINVDWPAMNHGETVSNTGGLIIEDISSSLSHYTITNGKDTAILSDMITVTRNLYDAREQRILASYASLSGSIWVVIILGTILTLCISYLFGVNFNLHIFTVLASALMMSSIIFLLISLDKPFMGSSILDPGVYKSIAVFVGEPTSLGRQPS